MLLVSWFTATKMEVNLLTYDISLQLVKPSALYKATSEAKNLKDEIDLHDVTISNGPTQREPELHSDGVRRSLLDSVMPWAAGIVDLWVVVCDQGMVRKIEAQTLYYFKEWKRLLNTIYLEIGWKFHDAINKHTYTHTHAQEYSESLPTGLLQTLTSIEERNLPAWCDPIRPLGTCFIEFSNIPLPFFFWQKQPQPYLRPCLIKNLFWNMSHRTHQWSKILWELAINHHP